MKTLLVGLGNIATIYGWALSQASVDITHVVRKGKKKFFEGGLKLDVLDLREGYPDTQQAVYHPKVVEEVSPADGYELIILPTKQYQLADAVGHYRDLVPDATFLMFTANWEGTEEIDRLLPRSQYLWGYAAANGGQLNDTLVINMRDDYRIGALAGCPQEEMDGIMKLFGKAGLKADLKENIIEWLWVHHAINAGLIGTALYAGGIRKLATDAVLLIFMVYAVRDSLKVLKMRGVDVSKYSDTEPYLQRPAGEFARNYADGILNTPYGQRVMKASHFQSNHYEMKRFYLDVLKTGEKLEVDMPHLSAMRAKIESQTT